MVQKKNKLDPRYLQNTACGGVKQVQPLEDTECPREGEFIKNGRKYLRLVTHDTVRDLVIPEGQDEGSVLFSKEDLQKIACSGEVEGADRLEEVRNLAAKAEQDQEESELRKRELREQARYQDPGPKLEHLERKAQRKANALLQKAKEVRQEDEDDIKLCNKLLLGTKCQAIRDVQLEEKKQIQKELEEEEKRLMNLMEQERKRKLAREENERLSMVRKREVYIMALNEQMMRNKLEREMEAERQLEESMILKEAAKQAEIDRLKHEEKKKMEQERIKMEVNKLNSRILELAEEEKEKSKLADLKIQELMKKKAEEERKAEELLKEERRQREIELAKLRALQEKSSDDQERRDAERAKKIQEQYEKQWMLKEKESAMRKAKAAERLKEERKAQIEERQREQAKERERENMEVARMRKVEEELKRRESEEATAQRQRKLEYKANLLKQINEKERQKIEERKRVFEEGIADQKDVEQEKHSLRSLMRRKVQEVKTHNIPEQYIKEVESKLKAKTYAGY